MARAAVNTESKIREAIQAVNATIFDPESWPFALGFVAELGGARAAQLIGGAGIPDGGVDFDYYSGVSDDIRAEFYRQMGYLPTMNPRSALCFATRSLDVFEDADFISEDTMARSPIYQELFRPMEVDYACLAVIDRWPNGIAALTVNRSRRQGRASAGERAALQSLLAHIRGSVQLRRKLEAEGVRLALGAFDALAVPVFVCGRDGRILSASQKAEEFLRQEGTFRSRLGQLVASSAQAALSEAIAKATTGAKPTGPVGSTLAMSDPKGTPSFRVEVRPWLGQSAGMLRGRAAMVVVFAARAASDAPLRKLGLSAAEAAVAIRLLEGAAPAEIAAERGARISTVRSQIKSCYSKLNVRRQSEFAAMVRHLL